MQVVVLLNRDSGTMRTLDPDTAAHAVAAAFREKGHRPDVRLIEASTFPREIDAAVAAGAELVVVGGGDGTVNTAAGRLQGKPVALGVLPLGTMNLYARTLGIPLDLEDAARALADGRIEAVDLAAVDDRLFVHQVAFGVQPRMARVRSRASYGGRLGKLAATAAALARVLARPRRLPVVLVVDGQERRAPLVGLAVSNNPYGRDHLPYADDPRTGLLGLYATGTRRTGALVRLLVDVLRGTYRDNPNMTVGVARTVELRPRRGRAAVSATIDGELVQLALPVRIDKRPAALQVMRPKAADPAGKS